jgi:hypothetical protein
MRLLWSLVALLAGISTCRAVEFEPCVRLKGGDEPVHVDSPGFAAPCWADLDGDGKKDLLVGQFNDGKIKVYKGQGDGTLAEGSWLKAGGEIAQVPGVW